MKKISVFILIILIMFSASSVSAYADFGTKEQPVLSAEQICAAVKGYIASHPEAEEDLLLEKRVVIGSWYKTDDSYWVDKTNSMINIVGVVIFTHDSTNLKLVRSTSRNGLYVYGSCSLYFINQDGSVSRTTNTSGLLVSTIFHVTNWGITALRDILLSTCDIDDYNFYGTIIKGASASDIPDSLFSKEINDVSENPIVGFSWDDVDSFKKYGANGDCYSLLVSDRGVSPFYQGSWNDRYEIRLSIDYFVASHDYADKVFQAFESCNFEFNDLFYDKVSELYSSGYRVGEAEISKDFVLHPYTDKGWYKDTKFLPGLSSFFSGISPITNSSASEIHKLQLSNYFFHPHFVRAYVFDTQSNSYGATTVYEYDKDGNFLSVFSYDDFQNENQFASGLSGSYLDQISELRQQVEDLQKRNEQLVSVNKDTLNLAGEIVQGDIATNTYKVANNMTEMIPIVGNIAMLISMAMLWLPKECLVVISFSVIAIAIISIYKALRG